jgi:putative ABC transport system ATP-binding protein
MVAAHDVVKTYHTGKLDLTVLKGVTLTVAAGEFVAIMGPSGAGKSTLLYQLGLLDQPTAGEVTIAGVRTSELSNDQRTEFRLRELGFVFQDYALLPELTAAENVFVTLLMQGVGRRDAYERARTTLTQVGLGERLGNLPAQLSGGEQQRVAVARAIVHQPKILFADEPTANLDTERSLEIMRLFAAFNRAGQTIVMVTHEPEYAAFAGRVITLKDGRITADERQPQGGA